MLFSENLTKLMEDSAISNTALGEIVGVSREAIRQWKTGQIVPTIDKAAKLAEYFDVSLDELFGKPLDTERLIQLPLVGIVAAGPFEILNEDQWDTNKSVQARLLAGRPKKECVLLEVEGDSMSPFLFPGDILVVHRQPYAVNGNIIVVYDPNQNGYTVKRYHQKGDTVILEPYNKDYKPLKYNNPTEQQLNLYGICLSAERSLI